MILNHLQHCQELIEKTQEQKWTKKMPSTGILYCKKDSKNQYLPEYNYKEIKFKPVWTNFQTGFRQGLLRSWSWKFQAKTFPSRPRHSQNLDKRSWEQDQDFWQRYWDQEQNFDKPNSSDLEHHDHGLEITRLLWPILHRFGSIRICYSQTDRHVLITVGDTLSALRTKTITEWSMHMQRSQVQS